MMPEAVPEVMTEAKMEMKEVPEAKVEDVMR